ncbi:MAG: divergent polysaccharide deacetylase family protein, partial [Rhodospirillaceae bacterium]
MPKRARKTVRKPNRKARKPAKRRPAPANGRGLARLVWATAGALAVAVLALGAILFFGPDAREPRPSPPVATIQVPAEERPVATDPAPPAQTMPQPEPQVAAAPQPAPAWRQNAMPASAAPGQQMIAIVIDDKGHDRARSERTDHLPAPLTLAYLAYASDLGTQTRDARAAGHELLVHVPMQPGPGADPGPNAVLLGLDPAELDRRMAWN